MEPTRRGVIDCIGAGFGIVRQRPVLVVLPILVDAFLWLAPRISPRPFLESIATQVRESTAEGTLEGGASSTNEQVAQALEDMSGADLLGVLGWQIPTFLHVTNNQSLTEGVLVSVGSWGGTLLMVAGLGLLSILLTCIYLGAIAQWVQRDAWQPGLLQSKLGVYWRRLTGYLALLTGAALLAFPLVVVVWAALQGLNPSLGGLFLSLAFGAGFMVAVHLFLVKPAIFLGELAPLEALRQSVTLVHRHFWSVLGFFVLVNIISFGVELLLVRIASLPLGLLVAVVGNAYLATGLTAAIMVYYWERRPLAQEQ